MSKKNTNARILWLLLGMIISVFSVGWIGLYGGVSSTSWQALCLASGQDAKPRPTVRGDRSQSVAGLQSVESTYFLPAATGLPSDDWRPRIWRTCAPGMSSEWAPCKKYPNLLVGEQLVYPDAKVAHPRFVRAKDRQTLFSRTSTRFKRGEEFDFYSNRMGRNFVFLNATYSGTPRTGFFTDACMGNGHVQPPTPHDGFVGAKGMPSDDAHDEVFFLHTVDSEYFQHFLDHTALMLTQARHLITNATKFMVNLPPADATRPVQKTVFALWQHLMGLNATSATARDRFVVPKVPTHAKRFIFACDTPMFIPYVLQRAGEIIMESAGVDPRGAPLQERKSVLVIKRTGGDNGRGWLNYAECVAAVRQAVTARGQGEEVLEFDPAEHPDFASAIRLFSSEARAVVGLHGGGLYNSWWMVPPAAMLEIKPVAGSSVFPNGDLFRDFAQLNNIHFWYMAGEAKDTQAWSVTVDCQALANGVVKMLEQVTDPSTPATLQAMGFAEDWSGNA